MRDLSLSSLEEVSPVYIDGLDGWPELPKKCKRYSDLPKEAKLYLQAIENLTEVPIKIISVGPERDQVIVK